MVEVILQAIVIVLRTEIGHSFQEMLRWTPCWHPSMLGPRQSAFPPAAPRPPPTHSPPPQGPGRLLAHMPMGRSALCHHMISILQVAILNLPCRIRLFLHLSPSCSKPVLQEVARLCCNLMKLLACRMFHQIFSR